VHEADPFNAEPPPAVLSEHSVTPVDAFYSRNHGPIPELDAATWRLTVEGVPAGQRSYSLAELQQQFETVTVTATLQCAGNRRAGLIAVRDIPGEDPWHDAATSTGRWTGVRLADVLAAGGIVTTGEDDDRHVAFAAPDVSALAQPPQHFGGSLPIAKALSPEVLLAWDLNGEALPAAHGAPVRVVVPGWIGARSVKWVERITVRRAPSDNYFQAVAYRLLPPDADPDAAGPDDGLSLGPIALNSAILSPTDGAEVAPGPLTVAGYAFAGDGRRVVRVDVSGDGGETWRQADFGVDQGRWAWRLWRATVDVQPGAAVLLARAWDDSGALQPRDAADLWNPKGYVNNSWPRATVRVTAGG
jgi:sulfite oxidase